MSESKTNKYKKNWDLILCFILCGNIYSAMLMYMLNMGENASINDFSAIFSASMSVALMILSTNLICTVAAYLIEKLKMNRQ